MRPGDGLRSLRSRHEALPWRKNRIIQKVVLKALMVNRAMLLSCCSDGTTGLCMRGPCSPNVISSRTGSLGSTSI